MDPDQNSEIVSFQGYNSPMWKAGLFSQSHVPGVTLFWQLATALPLKALLKVNACPVSQASFVSAKLTSGHMMLLEVESMRSRLTSAEEGSTAQGPPVLLVRLFGCCYVFDESSESFVKMPRMPSDMAEQLQNAVLALKSVEEGACWTLFNAPGTWSRRQRWVIYGPNQVSIAKLSFARRLLAEFVSPLFLFQCVQISMWMWAFVYYYYTSVLIAIMLTGCILSASLLHGQQQRLAAVANHTKLVPLVSRGHVRAMMSVHLVPGDVIVVQVGHAVCDMVLLQGNALAEESRLTGQGNPVRKGPYAPEHYPGVDYEPDLHRPCTIFAGSVVQQVWNESNEGEECLAMVVRTGLNSVVGKHLKSLLHGSPKSRRQMSNEVKDVLQFMALSYLMNFIIFVVQIPATLQRQLGAEAVWFDFLDMIINGAEPYLPALLVVRRIICVVRLRRQHIFVSDSSKLTAAARLDIVIFDKTGTLTVEQGRLQGVAMCQDGEITGPRREAIRWDNNVRKALALCNDLVPLHRSVLAGSQDEKQAFKSVEASFVGHNQVSLPLRSSSAEPARLVTMEVLRRFEFEPRFTLMSGVIARETTAGHTAQLQVLLKGPPLELAQFVQHDKLPATTQKTVLDWTARGFRVQALMSGKVVIDDISKVSLLNLKQHTSNMRLLGFAIFNNPLRADSASVIAELQDRARLRTMMVTGDNMWTAISVGCAAGILKAGAATVVMAKPGPELDQPVVQQLSKRPRPTSPCLQPACHSGVKGQAAASVRPHISRQSNPGEYGNKGAAAKAQSGHDKMEGERRVRFKAAQPAAAQDKSDETAPGQAGSEADQSVSGQAGLAVSPRQPQAWQPKGGSHKVAAFPVTEAPQISPKANDTLNCYMTDPVSQSARLISYTEAMQLIAEGTPSAITGRAFDHLLHHAEPAVMETVLQSLAIAASMQSDQKAQLVNMLSCQGLTQPSRQHFKGLGYVVGYCGDGLNDIPAIHAADVGIAVSATEAAVTAPLFTSDVSAKVVCRIMREARCGVVVTNALFKYLVLYGYILSVVGAVIFFEASNALVSGTQYELLDSGVTIVCLAMAMTSTCKELFAVKPQHRLMSWQTLAPILFSVLFVAVNQGLAVSVVKSMPWSDTDVQQEAILGTALTIAVAQLVFTAALCLGNTYPHCRGSGWRQAVLPVIIAIFTLLLIVETLQPSLLGNDLLSLGVCPFRFRLSLFGVLAIESLGLAALQGCIIKRKVARRQG